MFGKGSHNFLRARHIAKRERKMPPAAKIALLSFAVALVIAAALAAIIAPFWYLHARVLTSAERGRRLIAASEDAAAKFDFDTAIEDTDGAKAAFAESQGNLAALAPAQDVPVLGPNLVAADRLLSSGLAASSAARDVFAVARDIVAVAKDTEAAVGRPYGELPDPSTLFKDLTPEQKRRILAAVAESGPKLADAQARIDEALRAFDQIPADQLSGGFRDSLAPIRAKLVTMRAAIGAVQPLVGVLPRVLGYPDERNYLFFFENNTELRPTGGFLGVFGAVKVRDADIAEMKTDDVYALDGPAESSPRPASPAPIQKYVGVTKWYLRDANWSPDFPTSAKTMIQFFSEEAKVAAPTVAVPRVDGVVAVTPKFAEDVMRLTGPITVEGKTFTADNLVDQLEFQVEQGFVKGGVPFAERKGIVGSLVKAIVAKLSSFPLARLMDAAGTVDQDMKEGHMLLYSTDPSLQDTVLANGWGGAMRPVRGDYLMWVDANLAALKTDGVMQRDLSYSIAPTANGGYEGRVRMTYKNKGSFSWKTTRYRTYARLYVPAGTTLIDAPGAMENDKLKDPGRHAGKSDVTDELGRRAFGAFISVEPGETRSLEFHFALSPSVVQAVRKGTYALDVQKQAGTVAHGLTLDLDFGKKLTTAVPAEDRSKWGDDRYSYGTDLRIDRAFDLSF